MSQLMVSMSRSPRFWLVLVFFAVPLIALVVPGSVGTSVAATDIGRGPAEYDLPWTPAPLDATTDGTIIVRKVAYPRNTAQTFTFTGDVAGTIPAGGSLVVTDVPAPGTYTSTEIVPSGWNLRSIQCDDGSQHWGDTAVFNLNESQTLQCNFFNQAYGTAPCQELTGRWPFGPTYAVGVAGTTAFIGSGSALVSVDVSAPSSPVELDTVDVDQIVHGLTVNGSYIYVTTSIGYDGSLVVVDAMNPSSLQRRGDVPIVSPGGVEISGSYAFVASSGLDLVVVDVVDPDAPSFVTSLALPGYATDLALSGNLAYVATANDGIRVVDVSTPSLPSEIGHLTLPGYASGIDLVGQYAYLASSESGLRVVNVTNPALPVEAGFLLTDRARDVDVVGTLAYVADDWWGIKVINVVNPASPSPVGDLYTAGSAQRIVVDGGLAFMASTRSGLQIVDVSSPGSPTASGALDYPIEATDADLIGDYAYLSLGYGGDILVLDVSDPGAPNVATYLSTTGSTEQIQPAGSHAYVAAGGWGMRVLDVTDPSLPVDVGGVDTPGWSTDVAVHGNNAYVADASGGLRVMDVSTPSSPFEVTSASTGSAARLVVTDGVHAFVATQLDGIRVFDVTDPSNPLPVGVASPSGSLMAMALRGDHLFVVGNRGLRVLDVSDPVSPAEVGFYDGTYDGIDIVLQGPYAQVASSSQLLLTYDVSDPTAPILIDITPLASYPTAIAAGRSRLLVPQTEIELEIHGPCDLLFADDFETGNTGIWSVTAGGF